MPRARKPGPRGNRSDLPSAAASATQPKRLPTGQGYGQRAAAEKALGAAPMPDRSTEAMLASGTGSPSPGGGVGAPAAPDPMMAEFLAAAQAAQPPGEGLLTAPTTRPGEPITAGLDVGLGPGSDVLPPMAATGRDPSALLWAQQLPALALLASLPGSSPQVRQFYRRIRSQIPPQYYERTET